MITPAGINDEMRPIMRMTTPPGVERLDPDTIELGERIGRSWVLLFGLIPFDYDDLTLVRLDPGRGFLERSSMLSQRVWEHERTLEPVGGELPDHRPGPLGAPPRPPGPAPAAADRVLLPPPPRPAAAPLRRRSGVRLDRC